MSPARTPPALLIPAALLLLVLGQGLGLILLVQRQPLLVAPQQALLPVQEPERALPAGMPMSIDDLGRGLLHLAQDHPQRLPAGAQQRFTRIRDLRVQASQQREARWRLAAQEAELALAMLATLGKEQAADLPPGTGHTHGASP